MNVLVTGATGFLGRRLCARLEAQNHRLVPLSSKNSDLTVPQSLDPFNDRRYDQIYHLAAWTQAGDFCLFHPGEQWIINQQINTNVLNWWQKCQFQAKIICIGTSCAYAPDMQLVEQNYLLGEPTSSLFTYAMTKRMQYVGLLAIHKQFGGRYLCVVPSTLYGPDYHTDGRQMHFIYDLIRKIIHGKLYGKEVILWGDGYQRRELIYTDDFVTAVLSLANNIDNELVNIGAGEEFTIRYFAERICERVNYDFNRVRFDESRYVGARSKCLDITKLKRLVPDFKPVDLEAGLMTTIDWLMNQEKLHGKDERSF